MPRSGAWPAPGWRCSTTAGPSARSTSSAPPSICSPIGGSAMRSPRTSCCAACIPRWRPACASGDCRTSRLSSGALEGIRRFQAHRKPSRRLLWNRVMLHVWPVVEGLSPAELEPTMKRLGPATRGLGIEMLLVNARVREADGSERPRVIRFFPTGSGVVVEVEDPPDRPLMPYDEGSERIVSARRRGTLHPAEIVKMIAPAHSGDGTVPGQPAGDFVEHDLDPSGVLVPVQRPLATNQAGIVVGIVRNYTERRGCGGSLCSGTRPGRWVRWPSGSAGGSSRPSTSPPSSACRSSGSRSRPERRSRWTAAPRTWTG